MWPVTARQSAGFPLQDKNTGALAQNETVAPFVERTARTMRAIVVGVGKRTHGVEAERLLPADFLGTADQNGVVFAGSDQPGSGDDRLSAAGAGRTDVVRFSGKPEHKGKVGNGGRRHDPGNGKRGNFTDAFRFDKRRCIGINFRIRASAAAVDHRHVVRQGLHRESGFDERFVSGGNRHFGVDGHEAFVLLIENRAFHIVIGKSGNLGVKSQFPPFRDKHGTGFPMFQRFRILLKPDSDRSDKSASGYNDSVCHELSFPVETKPRSV